MAQKHKNSVVRRRQIINAARKLIIKRGSEHITVREIAKAVGITEGDIYRHFKSKKDILYLLVEDIEDTWVGEITRANDEDDSLLEVIDNVLREHISAIERRRGASFQVIAEIISLGDVRLNKKVSEVMNKYIGCLADLLSRGVKSGEIREDVNLEAAATVLFGIIQGLVNIWALNNYNFDPQEKYESLWHIFREAIAKRQN